VEATRVEKIQRAILAISVVFISFSDALAEGVRGEYLYVDQGSITFEAENACALFFTQKKEPKSVCTSLVKRISSDSKEFHDHARATIHEDERIKNFVAFPIPNFSGEEIRSKNDILEEDLHVLILYHGSSGEISSSKIKKVSEDAVFQNTNIERDLIKKEQESMELNRASLASKSQKRKEDLLLHVQELLETRDVREILAISEQVSVKNVSITKLEQNIRDLERMIVNYKDNKFLSHSNDKKLKGELSSMIRTLIEKSISR